MRSSELLLAAVLLLATTLPFVHGKDDEGDDLDGLFYFEDTNDWSNSAIYPKACISTSNGDQVVYEIFNKGHNTCKKKSAGTYQMDVYTFVHAYVKQGETDAENNGGDYEKDDEAMEFLTCQEYYYNNNMYYAQIGCKESTGKGFQVKLYSDMYCSQQVTSVNQYNMGIDISGIKVSFQYCKSCIGSSYGYNNNYNNNNNNNQNNQQNAYYGYYQNPYDHKSPLCSTANYYKGNCNGSCKRAAKKAGASSGNHSHYTGEGFSPIGKFFLWVMSFSAIFFLLGALAQRKKMSKTDAVLEDAAIKSAGVDKKYIPRIILGMMLFIVLLILFKRKILTWFFLTATNIGLLGYWMFLKNRAEESAAVNSFQLYGDNGGTMS